MLLNFVVCSGVALSGAGRRQSPSVNCKGLGYVLVDI